MIVITDILRVPIDEGGKVAIFNLLQQIKLYLSDTCIYSINGNKEFHFIDKILSLNKLLISAWFYNAVKGDKSDQILYIPEASATFFSFIRSKLLNTFTGKCVYLLALQHRQYHPLAIIFLKYISPKCIITQSKAAGNYLSKIGIKNRILPLGVDIEKYHEYDSAIKTKLRNQYGIESTKTVLLHVGHLQPSRNLEWFANVKDNSPEVEIIIIGSTYNRDDEKLRNDLQEIGIRLNCEFIPDMTAIYNLADYYIFPVLQYDGAIETPMSVLEAMACNLPIITTEFGSLPDTFGQDNDFHYVKSAQDILDIIKIKRHIPCRNREKIKDFTWNAVAKNLADIVEQ